MSGSSFVFIFGAMVIGLMCLFPPFICEGTSARHELKLREGYYPLFSAPQSQYFNSGRSAYSIVYQVDVPKLLGQIFLTTIATAGVATGLFAMKQR